MTDRFWPGPGARRARFSAPKFSQLYRSIEVRGGVRANFHGRFLGGDRKERPQFPRRARSCGRGDSNLALLRQIRSGAAARRSPLAERPGHPESRWGCHRCPASTIVSARRRIDSSDLLPLMPRCLM